MSRGVRRWFLGSIRIACISEFGSFAPLLDEVILEEGSPEEGARLALVCFDQPHQRFEIPWWLRGRSLEITLQLGVLVLRGDRVQVTRRKRPIRTVIDARVQGDGLPVLLAQLGSLEGALGALLSQPNTPEDRSVLRDYALSARLTCLASVL